MTTFWYYVIIVNVIGFILTFINSRLRTVKIDTFLGIVALIGGSVGTLIGILLFDRKADKENICTAGMLMP